MFRIKKQKVNFRDVIKKESKNAILTDQKTCAACRQSVAEILQFKNDLRILSREILVSKMKLIFQDHHL